MPVEDIHILFSYKGVLRSSTFQHNHYHYVSMILHAGKKPGLKRKNLNLNKKGEKKVKKHWSEFSEYSEKTAIS